MRTQKRHSTPRPLVPRPSTPQHDKGHQIWVLEAVGELLSQWNLKKDGNGGDQGPSDGTQKKSSNTLQKIYSGNDRVD